MNLSAAMVNRGWGQTAQPRPISPHCNLFEPGGVVLEQAAHRPAPRLSRAGMHSSAGAAAESPRGEPRRFPPYALRPTPFSCGAYHAR